MASLNPDDQSDDANLVRAAFWYHQVFLTHGRNRAANEYPDAYPRADLTILAGVARNHRLSTRKIYTFNFPAALLYLLGHQSSSGNPLILVSAKILRASGCFCFPVSKATADPHHCSEQTVSRRPECYPSDVESALDLTSAPPTVTMMEQLPSLVEPARRAIAIILLHGWQRFRSIRLVELRHIIVSPSFLEVIIPDGKGGWLMLRLPLDRLTPSREIAFLRDFLSVASLRFENTTRLTALAGFGNIDSRGIGARLAYRKALKHFGPMHDARRCGLSWAPIRAMVARNPQLLKNSSLPAKLRDHHWFTAQGLSQFLKLLPAEQTDSVEVFRRIAGWTSYSQFFRSYCRSWHLQLALSVPE